jgi:hypothetical protein
VRWRTILFCQDSVHHLSILCLGLPLLTPQRLLFRVSAALNRRERVYQVWSNVLLVADLSREELGRWLPIWAAASPSRLDCQVRARDRVPCAVCRVPCAVCRVPCAVCRVPCAVCRVPCAVCRVPCAVCRVPCAVCRVPCAVCRVPCAVCRVRRCAVCRVRRCAVCRVPRGARGSSVDVRRVACVRLAGYAGSEARAVCA